MRFRRRIFGCYGGSLLGRFLSRLLQYWMLGFVLWFTVSDATPHLRTGYSYHGSRENPVYHSCMYLGKQGYVAIRGDYCPVIKIMRGGQ